MAIIIAIFGPHGVGKTSLQNYAKTKNIGIREGFEFNNEIDDCSSWSKFWDYQMKYWNMVKEQLDELKTQNGIYIISRSFEEQIYYLTSHPISHGHEKIIETFINNNVKYKSDFLFYLDASFDVLKYRILNDKFRELSETRWWYRDRFYLYNKINKSHNNIKIIDTSKISTQEVFNTIMKSVNERK